MTGPESSWDAALAALGVEAETQRDDERAALDEQGFVVLEAVVQRDALDASREAFERAAGTGEDGERGTRHFASLPQQEAAFDSVYLEPRVLAAVHHVLARSFRLLFASGRDPQPGFGLQGMHTDWLPRAAPSPPFVVTTLWMLDAFREENGATSVVPGSHRRWRPMPRSMQQPTARHPEERAVEATAGSVLVFDGHLWHRGTRNESRASRRSLHCQFVARDAARPDAQEVALPERLPVAARALLGGGARGGVAGPPGPPGRGP